MILLGLLLAALPLRAHSSPAYEARPGLLSLSGWTVFFGVQGTMSYQAPAGLPPGAVDAGPVRGCACQRGISIPLGLSLSATRLSAGVGKGGYEQALADIRVKHPDLRGVYDVMVDDRRTSVVTVFARQCTEINARGFR